MGRIFDGGAAYPRPSVINEGMIETTEQAGISARDLFAAHALAGVLASYAVDAVPLPKPDDAAKKAYDYADAMLTRRDMPAA